MDLRSLINKIAEAEAPLPGTGQKGPTVAAAAGQDPSNPLNKASGQAAQPAAEWKPTPEQEKWLGGANKQDPYIMKRMPGEKPPVSYFKDPADQALAKQMGFPEAAPAQQGAQPAKASSTQEKIEKLNQLVDKLVALRNKTTTSGQPAQSAPTQSTAQTGQATQPASSFEFKTKDGTLKLDAEGKKLNESIAKSLVESFGYTFNEAELSAKQLGVGVGAGLAKAGLAKAGASTAARIVPGAGTALSAMDAYNRWKEGDLSGAVIAALAGIGWLVPGPMGWVLGGGLDAANIARDMSKEPPAAQAAQPEQKKEGDPKIVALQKYLVSQGATNRDGTPLKIDGLLGPNTRAAMDSAGIVMESVVNEFNPMQAGKAALNVGKNFVSGLKGGGLVQQAGKAGQFGKAAKGARTALKVGKTIGKHPYAATAGAAGLAGYGLGSSGDSTTTTAATSAAKPAAQAAATTQQTGQSTQPEKAWSDEEKELNRQIKDLAQELELASGNNPEVKKALSTIGQKMSGINSTNSSQAAQPEAPATIGSTLSDFSSKIGTYK